MFGVKFSKNIRAKRIHVIFCAESPNTVGRITENYSVHYYAPSVCG